MSKVMKDQNSSPLQQYDSKPWSNEKDPIVKEDLPALDPAQFEDQEQATKMVGWFTIAVIIIVLVMMTVCASKVLGIG